MLFQRSDDWEVRNKLGVKPVDQLEVKIRLRLPRGSTTKPWCFLDNSHDILRFATANMNERLLGL